MTQPVKLCLLPAGEEWTPPLPHSYATPSGPATMPRRLPLRLCRYGNARMVVHGGVLYLSLLRPDLELNEVDRDRAAALGYGQPLMPGPGWLSSDPGGPSV